MVANPQQQPWRGGPMAVEDYLGLDRNTPGSRYEYLDGVAKLMSGGSGEHDQISRNIANALEARLRSGPCFVRGSDMQVLIGLKSSGKENYVYPDTTVSCDILDRRRGNKLIRSPRIVAEVLSPSTERDDRGKKLMAYQACSTIQEVLLISQFAPHIEVYRRAGEEGTMWQIQHYGQDEEIELTSVDVHIPIGEIYKHIDFDEPLTDE